MPQPKPRLTIAACIVILAAAAGLAGRTLTAPSYAAASTEPDPAAAETLKPSELANLEALSNSFRKLARLSRHGVVQLTVGAVKAAEADPEQVKRLRSRFGGILSEDQIQKMARARPAGSGSGIIFDKQGHILTNSHVVKERDDIKVRLGDDRTYQATLVGIDTKTDVAVIKIDAPDLHPLRFADSGKVEVGDWVLAVGAPFGLTQTVTHGIISGTGRGHIQGLGKIYYQNFLQTDAAVNPGNSGGPLLNMRGEVLGINTAIATDDDRNAGVAFAIPANMAVRVARTLIDKGVVTRGWLGVSLYPRGMSPAEVKILGLPHDHGVLVEAVLADSPAQKAGLQVDDYITTVNGQDLAGPEQFTTVIGDFQPDEQVKLQVLRDGQKREVTVTLAQQPDDPTAPSLSAGATNGRWVPQLGLAGHALRPRRTIAYEDDDRGVLVTDVDEDGPCAKAVKPDEVIIAVNDHKIRNLAEMEAALKAARQQPQNAQSSGPRKIRIDILQPDGDLRLENVAPRWPPES